jgi:hypothetical protein
VSLATWTAPERLRVIALVPKWSGVILLFGYLSGCFTHPARVGLYQLLTSTKKDAPVDAAAIELFEDFGLPAIQLPEIGAVGLQWMAMGDAEPMAGYVYARSTDGAKIRRLATLEEFRDWAYSRSSWYGWISLTLVSIGLVLDTTAAARRRASAQAVPDATPVRQPRFNGP